MQFTNSQPSDLPLIFSLFDSAIAYQKRKGHDVWPRFDEQMIMAEIKEKRHWKMVDEREIACILSVVYHDPVIWGERDQEPSVYLHRIAVNPAYKGKRMMELIRHWAIEHAREMGKQYLRMDTWGNNENIRNYYVSCGFPYIGQQQMFAAEGLPAHYAGIVLSLFEIEVGQ